MTTRVRTGGTTTTPGACFRRRRAVSPTFEHPPRHRRPRTLETPLSPFLPSLLLSPALCPDGLPFYFARLGGADRSTPVASLRTAPTPTPLGDDRPTKLPEEPLSTARRELHGGRRRRTERVELFQVEGGSWILVHTYLPLSLAIIGFRFGNMTASEISCARGAESLPRERAQRHVRLSGCLYLESWVNDLGSNLGWCSVVALVATSPNQGRARVADRGLKFLRLLLALGLILSRLGVGGRQSTLHIQGRIYA